MGKKDLTEKMLEDYNDIFADIMNVVLFQGRQVVTETTLQEANTESWYEDTSAEVREQRRDISKYWQNGKIQFALLGIENQTKVDSRMPLRVISYDGAAYMSQYKKREKQPYPVITIVLYFGNERWNHNKNLKECIRVPESEEELKHLREVLNLMSAVTEDDRWKQAYNTGEGKVKNMCEVAERLHRRGLEEGLAEGCRIKALEIARSLLDVLDIATIAEKTGLSQEEVMGLKQG